MHYNFLKTFIMFNLFQRRGNRCTLKFLPWFVGLFSKISLACSRFRSTSLRESRFIKEKP
ncbi:unnamed protein product [Arabidopsis halleri]